MLHGRTGRKHRIQRAAAHGICAPFIWCLVLWFASVVLAFASQNQELVFRLVGLCLALNTWLAAFDCYTVRQPPALSHTDLASRPPFSVENSAPSRPQVFLLTSRPRSFRLSPLPQNTSIASDPPSQIQAQRSTAQEPVHDRPSKVPSTSLLPCTLSRFAAVAAWANTKTTSLPRQHAKKASHPQRIPFRLLSANSAPFCPSCSFSPSFKPPSCRDLIHRPRHSTQRTQRRPRHAAAAQQDDTTVVAAVLSTGLIAQPVLTLACRRLSSLADQSFVLLLHTPSPRPPPSRSVAI